MNNDISNNNNGVHIIATPMFLQEQSSIERGFYTWSYTIIVRNNRKHSIQLLSRFWRIVDSNGEMHEVRGEGVVGQQPIISPTEQFEYTSGTLLKTPSGIMMGEYEMLDITNGNKFTIQIPAFSLDSPYENHKPS